MLHGFAATIPLAGTDRQLSIGAFGSELEGKSTDFALQLQRRAALGGRVQRGRSGTLLVEGALQLRTQPEDGLRMDLADA
jgi:hypothetical protein